MSRPTDKQPNAGYALPRSNEEPLPTDTGVMSAVAVATVDESLRTVELFPDEFFAGVVAKRRQAFVAEFADTPLLLVSTNGKTDSIASGLLEGAFSRLGIPVVPNREAFRFATSTSARPAVVRPAEVSPLMRITNELRRSPHVVARLHKRGDIEGSPADRITLGRSPTSDIVLRDPSVSKVHAWFERDESGQFMVYDGNSKNGTALNGLEVGGEFALAPCRSGDILMFGAVRAMFTAAEMLWDAFHGAPEAEVSGIRTRRDPG